MSIVQDHGQWVGLYAVSGDADGTDSVSFHGGALVQNLDLQLIFWGSAWQTALNPSFQDITSAVQKILGSTYLAEMTQYGNLTKSLRSPSTIVLDDPPASFSFDDVGDLVLNLIDQGTFPEPDDDGGRRVYMVFMPQTATSSDPKDRGAHGDPLDGDLFDAHRTWVGWAGYGTLDYVTDVFTHELVEAISDPEHDAPAWIMDRTFGGDGEDEIGDACNNTVDYRGGILVEAYFSQAQRACVIPLPPAPSLSGMLPLIGGATGGTQVQIFGTDFDMNGRTQFFFGATPATSVTCSSTTSCVATAPASPSVGPVNVSVAVNTLPGTSTQSFTYVPSVTGLSAVTGGSGDQITIWGAPFGYASSVIQVSFGPYPASTFSCTFGSCTVTVPPGCGTVDVVVSVQGYPSVISPADRFSYGGPTINLIDPSSGPMTGNTDVNLMGSGLDQKMTVTFGGVPAARLLCVSPSWCVATSPPSATTGVVDIQVTLLGCTSGLWAGDRFTYTLPPPPPVGNLGLGAPDLFGGQTAVGTVTLSGPAPLGGAVVQLASSNPSALSVPSSVSIAQGGTTATFTMTALGVASDTVVTVTADTAGSAAASTSVTIFPAGSLNLAQTGPRAAVITLSNPAPASGAVVQLVSSDPSKVIVPASITVPAGSTSAQLAMTVNPVAIGENVTVTGSYAGSVSSMTMVLPASPPISIDAGAPDGLSVGMSSTGAVTLNAPAPAGGALIALTSSDPNVLVPASVTIPAGSYTATFTVTDNDQQPGAGTVVTLTATYAGASATNALDLNGRSKVPPPPPPRCKGLCQ